jgi:hypothetical protein
MDNMRMTVKFLVVVECETPFDYKRTLDAIINETDIPSIIDVVDGDILLHSMEPKHRPWGHDDLMVLAAFRYCLGRKTYIVSECCNWLIDNWNNFEFDVRRTIQEELEACFKRDDADRACGNTNKILGWDCDREDWERVRAIWNRK